MTHPCICCKKEYDCPPCNTNMKWACSTVNDDEDTNMCDACMTDLEDAPDFKEALVMALPVEGHLNKGSQS